VPDAGQIEASAGDPVEALMLQADACLKQLNSETG
jgi:hypothetical protein